MFVLYGQPREMNGYAPVIPCDREPCATQSLRRHGQVLTKDTIEPLSGVSFWDQPGARIGCELSEHRFRVDETSWAMKSEF